MSQQLLVEQGGTYTFSAYVSAGGEDGKLGIRIGDNVLIEMTIPNEYEYTLLSEQVSFSANDSIEVYVTGGKGWINVDEISLIQN